MEWVIVNGIAIAHLKPHFQGLVHNTWHLNYPCSSSFHDTHLLGNDGEQKPFSTWLSSLFLQLDAITSAPFGGGSKPFYGYICLNVPF